MRFSHQHAVWPAIAGLVLVIWRAVPTASVIHRALHDGLGAGWESILDADTAARLHKNISIYELLGPLLIRRRHVKRIVNLRYGDAGPKSRLDIYIHKARPSGRPALVYLHGGALMHGSKKYQGLPLLYQLASHGWVCISANYRLSPEATFPDHLVDAKRAIAWVRVHGQKYGADPKSIFVAGSSSGAQLAALMSDDRELQPGFEDADTSVAAAITLGGDYDWLDTPDRAQYLASVMKTSPTDDPQGWARASPITHV